MLFILLGIFLGLIMIMSLYDEEEKRIRKEKDDWKRIMGRDYK